MPLALIAETGVAGLLAQVGLIVGAVLSLYRRYRRGWTGYDAALLASFAALALGTLFQFFLYFPVFWLVAGWVSAGTGPIRGFSASEHAA